MAKTKPKAAPVPGVGMDEGTTRRVVGLLKLAADDVRLRVLLLLSVGPRDVGDLAGAVGATQPAMSHHLAFLRVSRAVEVGRVGKSKLYSLAPLGVKLVEAAKGLA